MRDFCLSRPNLVGYFDLHSYSQILMWPWGYTSVRCEDHDVFQELGQTMQSMMRSVNGMIYAIGPIYTAIYPASGGSIDWVYGTTGAMAMTYELRDSGGYGFLLPADQIIPNALEVWPALLHYADQVTAPLLIRFPEGRPSTAPPSSSVSVEAEIRPLFGATTVTSAQLFVDEGSGFVARPMTSLGGERFGAAIETGVCGSAISFYVQAQRSDGVTWRSPSAAPAEHYTTRVAQELPIASYSFSEGPSEFQSAAFGLIDGRWAWGEPTGTLVTGNVAEPQGGNPDGSGGACWSTKPATDENPESSDVDGGPTWLTTPFFQLAGTEEPTVSFAFWYFTTAVESFTIDISPDGSNWFLVTRYDSANAWRRGSLRVRDYLPDATQCMLRFAAVDPGLSATVTEAAVDDFVFSDLGCVVAVGDMNCDGAITVGDIGGFVLALTDAAGYAAQYPQCDVLRADMNADGVVTVGDIGAFVQLLTGG